MGLLILLGLIGVSGSGIFEMINITAQAKEVPVGIGTLTSNGNAGVSGRARSIASFGKYLLG